MPRRASARRKRADRPRVTGRVVRSGTKEVAEAATDGMAETRCKSTSIGAPNR